MNKILKPEFKIQAELYLKNLDRLIDQESYWFIERIGALKNGNKSRVDYIENTYLIPLNRKIREVADRMARL